MTTSKKAKALAIVSVPASGYVSWKFGEYFGEALANRAVIPRGNLRDTFKFGTAVLASLVGSVIPVAIYQAWRDQRPTEPATLPGPLLDNVRYMADYPRDDTSSQIPPTTR